MDLSNINGGINGNEDISFLGSLIKRLETATSKVESFILNKPFTQYNQNKHESSVIPDSNNNQRQSGHLIQEIHLLLDEYVKLSSRIGSSIECQASIFKEGVLETIQANSPSQDKISTCVSKVQKLDSSPAFTPLLRVVSELVPVLGWPWVLIRFL